ncbi:hypothetical protein VIGAN_06083300 [Vigna angularis var. angularis]|uniref:Uncharacterized protein n=1 Tax=Vigna angularis var. angularis TaxID=157739 RepID=A0A0S3SAE8_PHAAN|nr:hypothetical protein VIGAN_06083300 [Vigna angularis var. angularis]
MHFIIFFVSMITQTTSKPPRKPYKSKNHRKFKIAKNPKTQSRISISTTRTSTFMLKIMRYPSSINFLLRAHPRPTFKSPNLESHLLLPPLATINLKHKIKT